MPTWIKYSAEPLGSYLMCFRFLQVAVQFLRSGELPHHDHGHVDGIDEAQIAAGITEVHVPVDYDPYEMDDDLHPLNGKVKDNDDKKGDGK